MAIIIARKWATNARNSHTYAVHWLAKKFPTAKHLITLAVETDVLEVLVKFIKETEYSDTDVIHYQECVNEVVMDLHDLSSVPGPHYENMTRDLEGRFSTWAPETTSEDWRKMQRESVKMYRKVWDERFASEEDEKLRMLGFFRYVNSESMLRC